MALAFKYLIAILEASIEDLIAKEDDFEALGVN